MTTDVSSIVTDEMRACIGRTSKQVALPEPVGPGDIRRFVDATGDANPLWTDEAFARSKGYKGRVVPPIMILELYRRMESEEEEGGGGWQDIPFPPEYTDTRNAGKEVEWLQPLYMGDTMTVQHRLVDIVARQGRAGIGIYVTRQSEFRNGAGEMVVLLRATTVKLPASKVADRGGSGKSR